MFHLINRILAPRRHRADKPYQICVAQARLAVLYRDYGVADTGDGRFDCLILHVILLLHVLNQKNPNQNPRQNTVRRFGQELIEVMLEDWDHNFREMGVGDLAMGKRIKAALKGFYGRMRSYENGMEDAETMKQALLRNLYRKTPISQEKLQAMCQYVMRQKQTLQACSTENLCAGEFGFFVPDVP